jgi:hypothetical protein
MRVMALVVLAVVSAGLPALAWGPGAHAVIGMGVAQERGLVVPNSYLLLQAVYGTSGPDFAWGATEPLQSALGAATHDWPGYQKPWDLAGSAAQRAFAWGWLTHNQAWGADHYAHLESPLAPGAPGYVEDRAQVLAAAQGVALGTAHDFVEVAVDLLLDQAHPEQHLGGLLSKAAASRDTQIPGLLVRSYAEVPGASWLAIRSLESGFRAGMIIYGQALALPTGADDAAFVTGLATRYGLSLIKAGECLAAAKALCQEPAADYEAALAATIGLVAGGPWP